MYNQVHYLLAYRLTEITDHWGMRGQHVISMSWLYVAAAVFAAILGGVWLIGYVRRRRLEPSERVLFARVGRRLGLPLSDRWLLRRIAASQVMNSPLTLLCSPATLSHYAGVYVQALRPHRQQAIRQRVHSIGAALFDSPDGNVGEGRVDTRGY